MLQFRSVLLPFTISFCRMSNVFFIPTVFTSRAYFVYLDVTVACAITDQSVSEKGEVISTHYKLFCADIRDIPKLDSVIRLAEMDPRSASFLH